MDDVREYLRYYFLEPYLFEKVSPNFHTRGYLLSEEFFAIVIWKSSRKKTQVRCGIRASGKTIRELTSTIFRAETPEEKLQILTAIPQVGIPIASAVLTVCYPNDFTMVDRRALSSLKALGHGRELKGDPTAKIPAYLAYLHACKALARQHGISLRDLDRALWGRDFYEGSKGLKELASGLE